MRAVEKKLMASKVGDEFVVCNAVWFKEACCSTLKLSLSSCIIKNKEKPDAAIVAIKYEA